MVFALVVLTAMPSGAQNRGVYPLGMSATNSGVTPASGFTYVNQFLFYGRDQSKGPDGERVATGRNSVLMDMNSFVWVSEGKIGFLGGPVFSASATLPIANNSLSSDAQGSISGGGGFADSYYQPVILGWRKSRADLRAIYGFLAPTGRYDATASDNVGSGYWTNVVAAGQTFYLTSDKRTSFSAFQMYEFHTAQEGTDVHPGENFDLDYSLMQTFPLQQDLSLQLGVIGYGQWQTTDRTGPSITAEQMAARYRVNSFGFASNVMLPSRKTSLGFKYFKEFSNRSTFEGGSVQISGAVTF
ncbi:MAG TPA: transporter [Gemmatimonadaceae bacterium]